MKHRNLQLMPQSIILERMDWSPFSQPVMENPGRYHQALLRDCPVHHCADFDPPFYTLSRYEDVAAALRDIDTFSSEFGQGPRFTPPQGMLCDPPQHTQLRAVVQQAFTPKAMNELAPKIEALCHSLIDQIESRIEFDLHDDLAFPLPVVIIAGMLGVPTADLDQFKHWSDVQVAAMGSTNPAQYANDQAAFMAYMHNHLLNRRHDIATGKPSPDDLLTLIASATTDAGELYPEADALSVLTQLLVGGNETTTSLITNAMWRLLESPQQWQMLTDNPELADAVVEESLRFDPPVLGLYRNTTREVTLHDVTIPAGAKVYINYAAANRDDTVFTEPDNFDILRAKKRHMSFGLGVHFCLGAPMARLEATMALKLLATRAPNLQLVSAGERIAPFFLWGRRKLPVRVPQHEKS